MGRAEFLAALEQDHAEGISSREQSYLKGFIRLNLEHFCNIDDPGSVKVLRDAIYDTTNSVDDVAAQCGWDGATVMSTKQTSLLDLLYDPMSSKLFKQFLKKLSEWRGQGSIVFVAGKKAVLLTNRQFNFTDVTLQTVKTMQDNIPDIHIIPWPTVKKQNWVIPEGVE